MHSAHAPPPASKMAISDQLEVQQAKVMIKNLTEDQYKALQQLLRRRRPKVDNSNCILLKLPAELRNRIYHYVAADAHATIASTTEKYGKPKCSSDIFKPRPGLLGTCLQLYAEFYSVFYSPTFITLRYTSKDGGWTLVRDPKVLYTIVNRKHLIFYYSRPDTVEAAERQMMRTMAYETKSPTCEDAFGILSSAPDPQGFVQWGTAVSIDPCVLHSNHSRWRGSVTAKFRCTFCVMEGLV